MLHDAKRIIHEGSLVAMGQHALIATALNMQSFANHHDFLIEANQAIKARTFELIGKQRQKKSNSLIGLVNGGITVVGAVMLAIPFPPVQIVGAVLLLVSSLMGISLRYNLHGKLWQGFKKKMRAPKKDAPAEVEEGELIANSSLGLSTNAMMFQAVSNVKRPKYTITRGRITKIPEEQVEMEAVPLLLPMQSEMPRPAPGFRY
jgi:hypothetical protein